jgi:hypothetical protein
MYCGSSTLATDPFLSSQDAGNRSAPGEPATDGRADTPPFEERPGPVADGLWSASAKSATLQRTSSSPSAGACTAGDGRAAAAADALVAALDRPGLLARRVIQIRLHGRRRPPQPSGDLSDRQALLVAIVARERCRPATLLDTICCSHRRRPYRTWSTATGRSGQSFRAKGGTPSPRPSFGIVRRASNDAHRESASRNQSPIDRR